jgi:hypothetical protein
MKKLWCIVEGNEEKPFKTPISSDIEDIADLKEVIYPKINKGPFLNVNPKDLVLWKVRYF